MDVLADGVEPGPITRVDIETAAERIMGRVRRTPVQELGPFALGGIPGELVLKLELLQYTGSFKPRGAFNRMLAAEVDQAGVIAASGGNSGWQWRSRHTSSSTARRSSSRRPRLR